MSCYNYPCAFSYFKKDIKLLGFWIGKISITYFSMYTAVALAETTSVF